MGVGARLPGWVLDQDNARTVLRVSRVQESVNSGVVQRVYALGQQRAIRGFSTKSALNLTLESVSDEQWAWLSERAGTLATLRDTEGLVFSVIIGSIERTRDPSKDEDISYGVSLMLFLSGVN